MRERETESEVPEVNSETGSMSNMEQGEESKEYGEVLKDVDIFFHGINFDLMRLESILEHGILSQQTARARGVGLDRNYGGHNGISHVSIVESPSIGSRFDTGSFRTYIRSALSIVADYGPATNRLNYTRIPQDRSSTRSINKTTDRNVTDGSLFEGEQLVAGEISPDRFRGIMVPKDALSKRVSDLGLGYRGMAHDYVERRAREFMYSLNKRFDIRFSERSEEREAELDALLEKFKSLAWEEDDHTRVMRNREEALGEIEHFLAACEEDAYAKEMGKEHVTLADVLRHVIPNEMPIWDTDGFPLELRTSPQE